MSSSHPSISTFGLFPGSAHLPELVRRAFVYAAGNCRYSRTYRETLPDCAGNFCEKELQSGDVQNRSFSGFPGLQFCRNKICHPIGNKEAGFSSLKMDCLEFCVRTPIFWNYVFKSAPIRPVTGTGLKSRYALIESRLPFWAFPDISGPGRSGKTIPVLHF